METKPSKKRSVIWLSERCNLPSKKEEKPGERKTTESSDLFLETPPGILPESDSAVEAVLDEIVPLGGSDAVDDAQGGFSYEAAMTPNLSLPALSLSLSLSLTGPYRLVSEVSSSLWLLFSQ